MNDVCSKVSFFFSAEKLVPYWLTRFRIKLFCFFSGFSEEKKQLFFFSLEKFDRDSLVIQLTLVKYFPIIHWVNLPNFTKSRFWGCFFFQNLFFLFCFVFFFLEKFDTDWLTQIKKLFFFSGTGKNKKQHFYWLTRFFPKIAQSWTFPGK